MTEQRRSVVKWLRRDLTTKNGYDWSTPGQIHRFSGLGPLCDSGHAHVYASVPMALWLRPLHIDSSYCRLFQGEGLVSGTDGLKIGVSELVLDLEHEIVLPAGAPRPIGLVTAAITTSLVVAGSDAASYRRWATAWLDGRNRTARAAWAARATVRTVEEAAAWAAGAAAWEARATAREARAAAGWDVRAAEATWAAAAAEAAVATGRPLDLDAVAAAAGLL